MSRTKIKREYVIESDTITDVRMKEVEGKLTITQGEDTLVLDRKMTNCFYQIADWLGF